MSEEVIIILFDRSARNWSIDPDVNRLYLRNVHDYMFDMLRARGHLFLNEILDQLGIRRMSIGQKVGWLITDDRLRLDSKFSLWTQTKETDIVLRFETDGVIWDRI